MLTEALILGSVYEMCKGRSPVHWRLLSFPRQQPDTFSSRQRFQHRHGPASFRVPHTIRR